MKTRNLLISLILTPLLFSCSISNNTLPDENKEENSTPNVDNNGNNDKEPTTPDVDNNEHNDKDPITPETPKNEPLTIYSLNDTHGDFLRDPDIENYGIDGIFYKMKEETSIRKYKDPIFICTGDMFQGQYVSNVTRGKALVDALNLMNLEAFVLGNHEFDWGLDTIKTFKDGNKENGELNCDILCANLIYNPTNSRPDWIKPYTIIERNNHKVGIIGLMGEDLESSILAEMIKDYHFTESAPLVEQYTKELREEKGCDTVVVGIHDYETTVFEQFANLDVNIDAIFGGHTHRFNLNSYFRKTDGKKIYSIQSGCNNEGFSSIYFQYKEDGSLDKTTASQVHNSNSGDTYDIELKNILETKYAKEIEESNEVISNNFSKKTKSEWGRFVVNSLIDKFSEGAEVALINKAGIRNNTDYGYQNTKLYAKQLFRVLPFDNKIYQVKIPKYALDKLLTTNNKYHYWAKKDKISSGNDYILNIIDYVFDGTYDRNIWNKATKIKTLDLNIRDYVSRSIKEA